MIFERLCPGCGRKARFVCDLCWGQLTPATGSAVFVYDELARSILIAAKNHGRRDLLRPLGRALAESLRSDGLGAAFDVVTWVPASSRQRRARGYDQGRLLARAAAASLACPSERLLKRVDGSSQTGRSRAERLVGPIQVARRRVSGHVLLVDDVRTTGASLRSGVEALRQAGAESVASLAVATVP